MYSSVFIVYDCWISCILLFLLYILAGLSYILLFYGICLLDYHKYLIVKDGLDVMKTAIENIRESVAYWTATPK